MVEIVVATRVEFCAIRLPFSIVPEFANTPLTRLSIQMRSIALVALLSVSIALLCAVSRCGSAEVDCKSPEVGGAFLFSHAHHDHTTEFQILQHVYSLDA